MKMVAKTPKEERKKADLILVPPGQVFNSRTCQLVLGAGALAAAGLRSITAKHLALAAQCVGAVMALHPSLSAAFTGPLLAARRAVLLPDFERVLQVRRPHHCCVALLNLLQRLH